eukprot:CAMPEP_0182840952 /NCGR_PEP_ID=MMETSP0006_2-20121128/24755_1 /TAXON_ID=97485 /ORGANISM="Prymnesium parvum, Strain Texoma1" /LENGTH=404 /DNA_ID=CAMNT_0024970365 /DNA_START=285 /DNA_END=1501 /DNA_ORIENTATION=+
MGWAGTTLLAAAESESEQTREKIKQFIQSVGVDAGREAANSTDNKALWQSMELPSKSAEAFVKSKRARKLESALVAVPVNKNLKIEGMPSTSDHASAWSEDQVSSLESRVREREERCAHHETMLRERELLLNQREARILEQTKLLNDQATSLGRTALYLSTQELTLESDQERLEEERDKAQHELSAAREENSRLSALWRKAMADQSEAAGERDKAQHELSAAREENSRLSPLWRKAMADQSEAEEERDKAQHQDLQLRLQAAERKATEAEAAAEAAKQELSELSCSPHESDTVEDIKGAILNNLLNWPPDLLQKDSTRFMLAWAVSMSNTQDKDLKLKVMKMVMKGFEAVSMSNTQDKDLKQCPCPTHKKGFEAEGDENGDEFNNTSRSAEAVALDIRKGAQAL